MSTTNQLTGGAFQDAEGNPLADGFIKLEISQDAVTNGSTCVVSSAVIVPLDANGNVQTSPAQYAWPNDQLTPSTTVYLASVYSANGQLVWGPNAVQILSSPSPFNIGAWMN